MATVAKSKVEVSQNLRPQANGRLILFVGLASLLVAAFVLSLMLGSVSIPPDNVLRVLTGGAADKASWTTIILKFRLPKAITAILAGAALGVGGLQMQTLFRNPLADPFLMGTISGASLGVALVTMAGGAFSTSLVAGLGLLGSFQVVFAASVGAFAVMLLMLAVAQRVSGTMTLLILGLMLSYITGALVSVLVYFSSAQQIQAYVNWGFGSFSAVTWTHMKVLGPVVLAGLVLATMLTKSLNALLLGETYAASMGMNAQRVRFLIILSASLLAGGITAFCGPIAFLGIAIPHLCRGLFGTSDHRVLVPAVIIVGALLALVTDLVAQLPGSSTVLPLNAVTALTGAPVVVWVILRRSHLRAAFAG